MIVLLLGCATVEVTRITDANRMTAEGIRFWRPAPYLAVFGEKDGTCSGKLIYLPDPKEEYAIRESAGFGSASLKPTLTDGWNLTAFDATVDSKAADLLGNITKIGAPAGTKVGEKQPNYTDLSPGLYRIKMERETGSLSLDLTAVYKVGPLCQTLKGAPGSGVKDGGGKGGE